MTTMIPTIRAVSSTMMVRGSSRTWRYELAIQLMVRATPNEREDAQDQEHVDVPAR